MAVSDLSIGTNLLSPTESGCYPNFPAVLGLAVPKSPSQVAGTAISISDWLSISVSCRNSISGRISTSGIASELPRTCDLRTMVEVVSVRLTSPDVSLLASEQAYGQPIRKSTHCTGCCDYYSLEGFAWIFFEFLQLNDVTESTENDYSSNNFTETILIFVLPTLA